MKIHCDSSLKEMAIVAEDGQKALLPHNPAVQSHNEGEYRAVLFALDFAQPGDEIWSDSQLVVRQVSGEYQCRYPHLTVLRNQVRNLLLTKGTQLLWCPREENLAGIWLEQEGK